MKEVSRLILRAGPSDRPVLIQGESGTGKELAARALHASGGRANAPLVVVNCAAMPEALLESELFGHEKGAFTGAAATKRGLFELADGGTLFIDEIGEMPLELQAKLLRVLEDGSYRRVGGLQERNAKVRIISATNRKLSDEVRDGLFREDLYYRIDVLRLELPPLRHRREDIPQLVQRFAGEDWGVSEEAMQLLIAYEWPGNVRQLINSIEKAKIFADDQRINARDLPSEIRNCCDAEPRSSTRPHDGTLAALIRSQIEYAMTQQKGNKMHVARSLGISRRSLYRMLEKYSIDAKRCSVNCE